MEKIGLFIVTFISRMPFAVMYVLSDVAAFILYHIVRYRRAVVRNNLMRCFPSRSLKEIKKIEKEFYVSFTDVILEIVKSFTISREEIEKRFSIENEEQLRSYFKDGHDNIMIFGHCFNWEWLMFLKVLMPDMEALALYQRIENHEVNEFMKKTRQRFGMPPGATCIPVTSSWVTRPISWGTSGPASPIPPFKMSLKCATLLPGTSARPAGPSSIAPAAAPPTPTTPPATSRASMSRAASFSKSAWSAPLCWPSPRSLRNENPH